MIAFLIMISVAIYKIPESGAIMIIALVVMGAILVAAYLVAAFRYAERNPGASVLEGLHLVKYQQNEIAASDPRVIDHSPEGAQNSTPPQRIRFAPGDNRE